MNRFNIPALLLALLCVYALHADTYDERTLVFIQVPDPADREFILASPIDVVSSNAAGVKALLRPEEFRLVQGRGLSYEVLRGEMEKDRALWREADQAAADRSPSIYYTASAFNTTNPGSTTLMKHLLDLFNAHPSITRLYDIGDSYSGAYDIIAMKVTRNPDIIEAEPKIRIYGNIHGDERGGLMVACEALDWILANYATDASAQKLVDESELWFIPMGNPDGNSSNSRYNGHGVDLNRNFSGPEGPSDGAFAFSEPETAAIRDLTQVMGKRFATGLSFHGGETCFNSLWNYTYDAPSDEPVFWSARTPGSGCSSENGCLSLAPEGLAEAYGEGCTMSGFWFTNGADWYKTWGDTNDWSYSVWSTLDTTLEATLLKTPATSEIPVFCAEHRPAVINYLLKTFQGIHGVMADAGTGAPLDGRVTAVCTSCEPNHAYQAVFTDPAMGDFHRVLVPGTYTITCSATGYDDRVIGGLVVSADAATTANCAMGVPCTNNPTLVSVTPGGPLALCPGTGQTLTATSAGGSGLAYQWSDGASTIPGATSSVYEANAAGSHSYNCRITGGGCPAGVSDPTPTSVTWQAAPAFAGLTSVGNPQAATCTLDLAWNPAASPCGGITYSVYRSATTPVALVPGNLLDSGMAETGYADSNGLISGAIYYYIVRATDALGQTETNSVERSGAPTGAGSGSAALFTESFDGASFPPAGWTETVVGGGSPPADWARVTTSTDPTGINPHGGSAMAEFNSYHAQSGQSSRLARTAALSLPAGTTAATAVLWVYHETGYAANADRIVVQSSPDGTAWVDRGTVNRYDGSIGWKQHAIDLSALIGAGNFRIGYLGVSAYGNDTYLDEVSVTAETAASCVTGNAPIVRYDAVPDLVRVCGDDDAVVEPGEEWRVTVRLKNAGSLAATNVAATLEVNAGSAVAAMITAGNPADFGDIPVGGTAAAAYDFRVEGGAVCGNDLVFDLTGILSDEKPYPDQTPAFAVPVGSVAGGAQETAAQATSPLTAISGTMESDFIPSIAIISPDTVTLSYTGAYTPGSGTPVTLFGPDDLPTLNAWTANGYLATTNTPSGCGAASANHARSTNAAGTYTLTKAASISTVGYASVSVKMHWEVSNTTATQYLDWSTNGTTWTLGAASTTATSWQCDQTVVLPAGAAGQATLYIRFRTVCTNNGRGKVDTISITGTPAAGGTWTANARVQLVDPSATVTTLKAYGAADGSPYDVAAYYTGPGTYSLRLSENLGGTATVTGGSLQVVKNPVNECDASNCNSAEAPPPVNNIGVKAAKFSKAGADTLAVSYDSSTCSAEKVIILYGDIGTWTGYAGCAQVEGGSTGDAVIDSAGQTATWYNLLWTRGTTAGHPGYSSTGARTWEVGPGVCGMMVNNQTRDACP